MREFKFRAWHKVEKVMAKVELLNFEFQLADLHITHDWFIDNVNFSDIELMQYTGLKDRNGKEIYEGDIVSVKTEDPNICYIGYIDFNGGAFYFNSKKKFFDGEHYTDETLLSNFVSVCEVIGNIYENEELLKQKE